MKKNKITIFAFLMIIALILPSCAQNQTFTSIDKDSTAKVCDIYFPETSKNNIIIDADIISPAKNLKELYKKSHAIVIGYVSDTYQVLYNRVDIASSMLTVEQVIKGPITTGEKILIEETGVRNEDYDISIGGAPLLKNKMKVLLFLTEPSNVIQGKPGYGIIDCVLGKFYYDNKNVLHPSSEFTADNFIRLADLNKAVDSTLVIDTIKKIQ